MLNLILVLYPASKLRKAARKSQVLCERANNLLKLSGHLKGACWHTSTHVQIVGRQNAASVGIAREHWQTQPEHFAPRDEGDTKCTRPETTQVEFLALLKLKMQ